MVAAMHPLYMFGRARWGVGVGVDVDVGVGVVWVWICVACVEGEV